MTPWTWDSAYPAPAKLNLFLHVVGRRSDGYHLLQTVFRLVDHGDTIRFAPRDDGRVVLARPLPGVPPEADLCIRAARLLQAEAAACDKPAPGATISVDKRLPMGGGLGGGSSDAATVLLALNHLWRLGLSSTRLQEIGLGLGADVPVFVFGANAFAEGVGERLQALDLPPAWYLVLEPPVQVPTADIFRSPGLRRDTPLLDLAGWCVGAPAGNDLEAVVVELHPIVGQHLAWLRQYGASRMTGSGACVFVEFDDPERAAKAFAALPPGMRGWTAAGLAEHPLRSLASG